MSLLTSCAEVQRYSCHTAPISDRVPVVFRQDAGAIEVLLRQDIDLGAHGAGGGCEEPGRTVPSPADVSAVSLGGSLVCSPEPLHTDDGDSLVPLKPAQQVATHGPDTSGRSAPSRGRSALTRRRPSAELQQTATSSDAIICCLS